METMAARSMAALATSTRLIHIGQIMKMTRLSSQCLSTKSCTSIVNPILLDHGVTILMYVAACLTHLLVSTVARFSLPLTFSSRLTVMIRVKPATSAED